MTALSADREYFSYGQGEVREYPVYQATTIYQGGMVCLNSTGYAIAAAATAGNKLIGICTEKADNSAGSSGDINVKVAMKGVVNLVGASLTLAKINTNPDVWVTDDQTVTTSPGVVYAGKLVWYESATKAIIDFEPALYDRKKSFIIPFYHNGTVGTSPITLLEDCELPRAFSVKRAYAKCQTAPGSTYKCTVTLTDGTNSGAVEISATATKGEDEAISCEIAADTDFDITIVDDNASAATDTVQGYFVCEER